MDLIGLSFCTPQGVPAWLDSDPQRPEPLVTILAREPSYLGVGCNLPVVGQYRTDSPDVYLRMFCRGQTRSHNRGT